MRWLPVGEGEDEPALWRMVHEDGDEEDLEKVEVEEALQLFTEDIQKMRASSKGMGTGGRGGRGSGGSSGATTSSSSGPRAKPPTAKGGEATGPGESLEIKGRGQKGHVAAAGAGVRFKRGQPVLAKRPGGGTGGDGDEATATAVDDEVCRVCGKPDSAAGNQIVLCDGCDAAEHQQCAGLKAVPGGDWFCGACARARAPLKRKRK
jgi:hypothetical protein